MKIFTNKCPGLDFTVCFPENKKNTPIKLLQLTDMQIIDSTQMRTKDRLRIDEINAWNPKKLDENFGNHVKSLISQARPDLIFITGDMVYGEFDDSGKIFEWFCDFMDSFSIPWAVVFGNHDNESEKGVDWQCEMLENTKYGIFKRGSVSGNSNYTIGISVGGELIRVIHMLDSHGCLSAAGVLSDQLELVRNNTMLIRKEQNKNIPGFIALHFPPAEYEKAEIYKEYASEEKPAYVIGVDVDARDDDFGSKQEIFKKIKPIPMPGFLETVKDCNIQAVFAGHFHSANTCITYENVKWIYGLKTGQYDYHTPGQIGGTLVQLENENFTVSHLPSLVRYAPFPGGSIIFNNFFDEDEYIV